MKVLGKEITINNIVLIDYMEKKTSEIIAKGGNPAVVNDLLNGFDRSTIFDLVIIASNGEITEGQLIEMCNQDIANYTELKNGIVMMLTSQTDKKKAPPKKILRPITRGRK